ncbi:hypothetical protein KPS64_gp90 [Shigella phage KPS64]|uniref:DUF5681 domain-containing protein n=1 Tax=Shigella phage KPS64 TaxID=2530184 RepID=A0A482JJH4_9CAUD|nr:hypothetical protein KPS64_gp90 [Shigella phage KPS64]
MTKRTNKGQFKKGQSGNPSGRPKGSRNKSSLVKAQLTIDNSAEYAAKLFEAVVTRDPVKLAEFGLTVDNVNLKSMMEAGKTIMTHSAGEMKAIAADSKKPSENGGQGAQENKPTFSAVATLKK